MIIAANDITQRRQALFYPLDLDVVREGIPQMLQFLVCCRCGDEEAIAVPALLLKSFFILSLFSGCKVEKGRGRRTQQLNDR